MLDIHAATEAELSDISKMSEDWEREGSTYGFRADELEYLRENQCWIAYLDGEAAGYVFGNMCSAQNMQSIFAKGTPFFEVEELYVKPRFRSNGIGGQMMSFVEGEARAQGADAIVLSTATKDHRSILRFYIDKMDMTFWSARLFKRL